MVDNDVVRVDAALGQLLDQPLRLIQREELGDAHADEGGLFLEDARHEVVRMRGFTTRRQKHRRQSLSAELL